MMICMIAREITDVNICKLIIFVAIIKECVDYISTNNIHYKTVQETFKIRICDRLYSA